MSAAETCTVTFSSPEKNDRSETEIENDAFSLVTENIRIENVLDSDGNFQFPWKTPVNDKIALEILLPVGFILDLSVIPSITVVQLKEVVLEKMFCPNENYPVLGLVRDPACYYLSSVSRNGHLEDLPDEERLMDLSLPFPIIKMMRVEKNDFLKHQQKIIGCLIGKSLGVLDKFLNSEINEFRWSMSRFAKKIAKDRRQGMSEDWKSILNYHYPPRILDDLPPGCFSPLLEKKLEKTGKLIRIRVWFGRREYRLKLPYTTAPGEILSLVLAAHAAREELKLRSRRNEQPDEEVPQVLSQNVIHAQFKGVKEAGQEETPTGQLWPQGAQQTDDHVSHTHGQADIQTEVVNDTEEKLKKEMFSTNSSSLTSEESNSFSERMKAPYWPCKTSNVTNNDFHVDISKQSLGLDKNARESTNIGNDLAMRSFKGAKDNHNSGLQTQGFGSLHFADMDKESQEKTTGKTCPQATSLSCSSSEMISSFSKYACPPIDKDTELVRAIIKKSSSLHDDSDTSDTSTARGSKPLHLLNIDQLIVNQHDNFSNQMNLKNDLCQPVCPHDDNKMLDKKSQSQIEDHQSLKSSNDYAKFSQIITNQTSQTFSKISRLSSKPHIQNGQDYITMDDDDDLKACHDSLKGKSLQTNKIQSQNLKKSSSLSMASSKNMSHDKSLNKVPGCNNEIQHHWSQKSFPHSFDDSMLAKQSGSSIPEEPSSIDNLDKRNSLQAREARNSLREASTMQQRPKNGTISRNKVEKRRNACNSAKKGSDTEESHLAGHRPDLCLKIVFSEEYLIRDCPVINYETIRNRFLRGQDICLIVRSRSEFSLWEEFKETQESDTESEKDLKLSPKSWRNSYTESFSGVLSIQIQENLTIKFESLTIPSGLLRRHGKACDLSGLRLMAAVSHGNRLLSSRRRIDLEERSSHLTVDSDGTRILNISGSVEMDIQVCNLPRMARLCLGLYLDKRGKITPLACVNTVIFDHKLNMKSQMSLYFWNFDSDYDEHDVINPIRTSEQIENFADSFCIVMELVNNSMRRKDKVHIVFPHDELKVSDEEGLFNDEHVNVPSKNIRRFQEELERIARRDPLHQITEKEKELLRGMKDDCRLNHPTILPRIIDCIDYTNYEEVRELHRLLVIWPVIPVDYAIQLLDYAYPDEKVHDYAVRCLRKCSDEDLERYLNQMICGIKHQNFFRNSLVEFLLERTIRNRRLGQRLFWLLRSEVRRDITSFKCLLILECYLGACPQHVKLLEHQKKYLDKLKSLDNSLAVNSAQSGRAMSFSQRRSLFLVKANKFMSMELPEEGFICPMEPTLRCHKPLVNKCTLLKSKKMPQKIVLINFDYQFVKDDVEIIEIAIDMNHNIVSTEEISCHLRPVDDQMTSFEADGKMNQVNGVGISKVDENDAPLNIADATCALGTEEVTRSSRSLEVQPIGDDSEAKIGSNDLTAPERRPHLAEDEKDRQQSLEAMSRIVFIYKTGDDLRQDSLVLNMIQIMERLWKDKDLDLRMLTYLCVPLSKNEGLIEMVQDAETICKIQMEESANNCVGDMATWMAKATTAFKSQLLYRWLRRHNPTEQGFARAIQNFKLSCAGYTVATYVLGIGDRHNDNIMLQRSGLLFHIDFGHILGNFKSKFGIRRERAPLLLPTEFLAILQMAGDKELQEFQTLCEEAYLALRENGALIISLLAIMLSTGLPDLSKEDDLNYVRSTLQLTDSISQKEALQNFRKLFEISRKQAYMITINWWLHTLKQIS